MSVYNINKIQLPNGDICNLRDNQAIKRLFNTEIGSMAYIADAAPVPVKQLILNISPVQAGTGDPSPDNIRPISGWTEAKVYRNGKNLIDAAGINHVSGTKSYKVFLKSGTYYIYQFTASAAHNSSYRYSLDNSRYTDMSTEGDEYAIAHRSSGSYQRMSNRFTLYQDCWFALVITGNSNVGENPIDVLLTTDGSAYDTFPANTSTIEYKQSMYVPYSGDTYSIDWQTEAGTVYGGTLDVTTGELVVDRASIDLGDLNWAAQSANNFFYTDTVRSLIELPASDNDPANILCSHARTVSANAVNAQSGNLIGVVANSENYRGNVRCRFDGMPTTANNFKAAVTGWQLVYGLATPITYQLTPTEVRTLLGQNNIYADTGDVSVTYYLNSDISIEFEEYKKLQTPVSSPIAFGTATSFISDIVQNTHGVITAMKTNVPNASISTAGIVQLNNTISSTSVTEAATAAAVKTAYDLAQAATIQVVRLI